MQIGWKFIVILLIFLFILCISSLAFAEDEIIDIEIISHPISYSNGVLEIEEIKHGVVEIGEVSLVITSTVPWRLKAYVESKLYPQIKPPQGIIEYYFDNIKTWRSIEGQVIKQGEPTNGDCYTFDIRYNLVKWRTFCSGSYSFDMTFILEER